MQKIILITGSTDGIGLATAEMLGGKSGNQGTVYLFQSNGRLSGRLDTSTPTTHTE